MTTTATRPTGPAEVARGVTRSDRGENVAHRPMVVPPTCHLRGSRGMGHLRDRPRLHAQVVLRGGLPLPHPVLLAVSDRPVCRRARPSSARRCRAFWLIPEAAFTLPFLLLFRLTCYYYRKAYYRAFWLSPPACAVPDAHPKYTGETRFPLIFQNVHRYAFYAAGIISLINTWDAIRAFHSPERVRLRAGQHHPGRQRGDALGVHVVLPLLPAHRRRPAQALLQAPGALPVLDLRVQAEHPAHACWPGSRSAPSR